MKILLCFGTRPEAIKLAPLYHELKKNSYFEVKVCVTAQHREMLDQVLDFFEIKPDFDLNLMIENQTLNSLSSKILNDIDIILKVQNPDLVIVHGDTTTSSIVALAAFHRNIKIGHVEAGLRTYNKNAPYPEEINRQITSRLADFHFAPTLIAQYNLYKEGIPSDDILLTGNTVIDAVQWAKFNIDSKNILFSHLEYITKTPFILVTGHRRENFGDKFVEFCEALLKIVETNEINIIFPVHLNPKVEESVNKILGNNKKICLLKPVNYPEMIWLMNKCSFIISDSGGIQEEAPTLKKHVLVTRDVSERPEGLEMGFSTLVGTNKDIIVEKANHFIKNPFITSLDNPYGDGTASTKIVEFLYNKYI